MNARDDPTAALEVLDLPEYEARALAALIEIGRTTAPDLVDATDIPQARIYGVLEALADAGYIKVYPGRPKEFQPKPPGAMLDRAVENRRQAFESYRGRVNERRDEILDTLQPLFESAAAEVSPAEELFHIVDVGEASERETRTLYREAEDRVHVLTKSLEYVEAVEPAIVDALDRDLELRIIMLDPALLEAGNRSVQAEIVDHLRSRHPEIDVRFSTDRLPWRGTIVDPSLNYDRGAAIVLVEEPDIPLHKREAAVTNNASFVAGLERYFSLIWRHSTLEEDPYNG